MNSFRRRKQNGQVTEFGAVFCILICFVFLPLLNMSFIPVRYMISEGVISELSRRLGHCEKFSEARNLMNQDKWWLNVLSVCGVSVKNEQLQLVVTTGDGTKTAVFNGGSKVPDEWLPGGANSPCIYSVALRAECTISALYQGPFAPAVATIVAHSQWENLSKDPKSLNYFINE